MRFLVWGSLIAGLAHAQSTITSSAEPVPTPYEHLPPPPLFADGKFTSPDNDFTQILTEGTMLNVSWETKYEAINLFFGVAGRGGYKFPDPVAVNQAQPWIYLEIKCRYGNCSLPHRFRAVNASGTQEERATGGFVSSEFWIAPDEKDSGSSSSSSAASSTASPTSSSSSTSTTPANAENSGSSNNSTAIGVGVGVGVGGAILILGAVYFFWLRRRKQKPRQREEEQNNEHRNEEYFQPPQDVKQKEPIHEGDSSQVYEAYAPHNINKVHEAPTTTERSELPGSPPD